MGGPDAEKIKNMSEEERQKFMQENRQPMDFRGPPPGEGKQYQPEGMMPPESFRHSPEGQPAEFQQQYQQQYQEQYKQEYQRQYEQQYQQQSQQFMPPPGEFRPPEGGMLPPGEYHPPEGGGFVPPPDGGGMMPPPDGGMMQPPPDGGTSQQPPPPPPSDAPHASAAARFVASVFYLLAGFFQF